MLREQAATIQSRENLARFVGFLAQDIHDHPDAWENPGLKRYLDALSAWIDSMDGYFRNVRETDAPEAPSSRLVGEMLLAAKYIE